MNKKIRISVLVQQQLIIIEQEPLPHQTSHVSQVKILCSKNGSLSKSISPNHMKTSPIKAVIRLMLNTTRRYYICYNTDMFSQSLESQTDFIMFKHGNHWKWSPTHAHTLQWITLTLIKTERTFSITLETQVSLTNHTFDIFYLIFLFLFVTLKKKKKKKNQKKKILGHSRDNRMRCEHTFFLNKRNISMYIKICKLPNQLCCKV